MGGARLEIRRVKQLLQLPIKKIMVNRTKTVAVETERIIDLQDVWETETTGFGDWMCKVKKKESSLTFLLLALTPGRHKNWEWEILEIMGVYIPVIILSDELSLFLKNPMGKLQNFL